MVRPSFAVAFVAALSLAFGCVASKPQDPNALPAEVDVEDPDPEDGKDGPKFCNPAGKQGAELQACYQHNEALYKEFDDEAKKREPWFNFTPDSWVESPELDQKFVIPVAKEKEAVAKLESAPFAELTPTEVEFFTGKPAAFDGLKPYLVRALFYYRETGGFSVFEKDHSILVRHDSVGKEITNETRSAVVVFLGYAPQQIYVDCGVAE